MSDSNNLAELKEELSIILQRQSLPKKAVVTGGMPYANGQLHIGHLAGAHVPADIYARFMRMMIGLIMFFLYAEQMITGQLRSCGKKTRSHN